MYKCIFIKITRNARARTRVAIEVCYFCGILVKDVKNKVSNRGNDI